MPDGFEAVYRDHARAVHGYLVRMTGDPWTADELCQETFVRYLRHQRSLHGANGSLPTWLFRVATNLVLDARRRRRLDPLAVEPAGSGP
ncbi:MAG: RNA polymerase sigma factor, partial [Planctomycetota bacterium]